MSNNYSKFNKQLFWTVGIFHFILLHINMFHLAIPELTSKMYYKLQDAGIIGFLQKWVLPSWKIQEQQLIERKMEDLLHFWGITNFLGLICSLITIFLFIIHYSVFLKTVKERIELDLPLLKKLIKESLYQKYRLQFNLLFLFITSILIILVSFYFWQYKHFNFDVNPWRINHLTPFYPGLHFHFYTLYGMFLLISISFLSLNLIILKMLSFLKKYYDRKTTKY